MSEHDLFTLYAGLFLALPVLGFVLVPCLLYLHWEEREASKAGRE